MKQGDWVTIWLFAGDDDGDQILSGKFVEWTPIGILLETLKGHYSMIPSWRFTEVTHRKGMKPEW